MNRFINFLQKNKEKIYKIAEANTVKNKEGMAIITKDDEWRNETEWDVHYEELKSIK